MLITRLRKSAVVKGFSLLLAITLLTEMFVPTMALALTAGPSQPEVQSFEPVQTTEMVDLFTGDFNYNIPLFELPGPNGGYPFNLAYHAGVGMDQEASWVGLGWNINVGTINRTVRGIPDDFNGDLVITQDFMKKNQTYGLMLKSDIEKAGASSSTGGPGENAPPDTTNIPSPAKFSWNAALSIYYNNYKGVGYSLTGGVHPGTRAVPRSGLGANVSLDSQEGMNTSLFYSKSDTKSTNDETQRKGWNIGMEFGSRRGLGVFIGRQEHIYPNNANAGKNSTRFGLVGNTSVYYTAEKVFQPVISHPVLNTSLNISFKTGLSNILVFNNVWMSGFFSTQSFTRGKKPAKHKAYGYNHLHEADNNDSDILRDFSREKDGLVYPTSLNLSVPNLTNDIYAIQGQGTGGVFRSFRNDVGAVYDPFVASTSVGGSAGFEIGAGSSWHAGVPLGFSYGRSTSGRWDDHNEWDDHYRFTETAANTNTYEPSYYKVRGEYTSFLPNEPDFIGGIEKPSAAYLEMQRPALVNKKYVPKVNTFVYPGNEVRSGSYDNQRTTGNRVPRNTAITTLTNEQIKGFDNPNTEDLGEYRISFYDMPTLPSSSGSRPDYDNKPDYTAAPSVQLPRDNDTYRPHHQGGITVLSPEGQRHVYALPAYNKKQREVYFSVGSGLGNSCGPLVELPMDGNRLDYEAAGSNKVYSSTETPAYAHSYLLTSVLGADYVDVDHNGPSDEDFGYWVKFDYLRYASNYKWRAPFKGANYNKGLSTTHKDNTGSYTYGEKEVWYLARAETKTHIAIFHTSERKDLFEAYQELNKIVDGGMGNFSAMKLDSISLYLKADFIASGNNAVPLQRVHFAYDYSLCPGTENSADVSPQGKLTLKKMWVTYEQSKRGKLNPYAFSYTGGSNGGLNPYYDLSEYDRWGNYKPRLTSDVCDNREFPYVDQFAYSAGVDETIGQKALMQEAQDERASAWCLQKIEMPTGGTIEINYEADDYAYVQHREATQMAPITFLPGGSAENELYDANFDIQNYGDRRIYFKLENPIPVSHPNVTREVFVRYISGLKRDNSYQLYFRTHIDIRDGLKDYVAGYMELEEEASSSFYGGSTVRTIDGVECYTQGYLTFKPMKDKKGHNLNYHPISMAAWQYLRTSNPDLLWAVGTMDEEQALSDMDKFTYVKSLIPAVPQIIKLFRDYRKRCRNQGWGKKITLGKSFIKLCSPDLKKYGGGHRVKKLTFTDNWKTSTGDLAENSEYGQVYDYTTTHKDGRTISSGVAQYEPMIGGDENPLRYAKFYKQNIPVKTANDLFSEHPYNESYFPSAVVGYSKVSVKSLATDKLMRADLPEGVTSTGSSGVSVHEFYTAKEFPVIVTETKLEPKPFNLFVPLPFIGYSRTANFTASQGYMIELNDMHGRPKAVSNYGVDRQGRLIPSEVSSVRYEYQSLPYSYEGIAVNRLQNEVDVLLADHDYSATPGTAAFNDAMTEKRVMGVEYEFFTDQRQSKSRYVSVGINLNADVSLIPFLSVWPEFNSDVSDLKTVVTNKIVQRSGILKATVATDGQSTVRTDNLLFDAQTGRPLLTSVNNNFDRKIYNYEQPAFWAYSGMGAAYKNIGMTFKVDPDDILAVPGSPGYYSLQKSVVPAGVIEAMQPGDEYIVSAGANTKAVYLGDSPTLLGFASKDNLAGFTMTPEVTFTLYRSGFRNHLNVSAGSITALKDPTRDRRYATCISPLEYSLAVQGDGWNISTHTVNDTLHTFSIDSVLQIQAMVFNDGWLLDYADVRSPQFNWWSMSNTLNPYEFGEKGIWSPQYTYVYKDDRKQSVLPKIATDGVMDSVMLFNWQKADFLTRACAPGWIRVNEVTRYSPYTYELENKNVLGIYSAALYGYKGSLPTAVAGNARKSEIGTEGFEEYAGVTTLNQLATTTGNIDLYSNYNTSQSYRAYEYYDILIGYNDASSVSIEIPQIPAGTYNNVKVSLVTKPVSYNGHALRYNFTTTMVALNSGTNTVLALPAAIPNFPAGTFFRGKVGIPRTVGNTHVRQATNAIQFVNTKAHSGNWAMEVNAEAKFGQARLKLQPGKKYVLSAWVSRPEQHTHDYSHDPVYGAAPYLQVSYLDGSGSLLSASPLADGKPKGRIIEGWQRVELEFTPASGTQWIELVMNPGTAKLFVDDLRIFPADGNLKAYVYDNRNLRLAAQLDENNYATFYSYDSQGNLFLIKKETAKGVQTVQESRGHIIEKPQVP